MTNRFTAIVAMLCFAAIAGCDASKKSNDQSKPGDEITSAQPAVKPKIALIMKSLANEFFSTMAEGARSHNQSNPHYELIVNGIKDERDLARQSELVDEMVAAGCKAIVIAPADSKH